MFSTQDCDTYCKHRSNAIIKNENEVNHRLSKRDEPSAGMPKINYSNQGFPHRIRISHQAAEFETGTRIEQNVPLHDKVYADKAGDEANYNDSIDGETIHSQKQLSSSTDYAGVGKVESTPSTCTSNVETIFSPILESIDIYNECNVQSNGETLVHSSLENCNDADFSFPVLVNTKENTVYAKKLPHLRTFLERVAENFEVIVFSASQSIYMKQLVDILDPERKLISHQAYRESCTTTEGIYTKDLTVLGVGLVKSAIIDNSPQVDISYATLSFHSSYMVTVPNILNERYSGIKQVRIENAEEDCIEEVSC